MIKFIKIQVKLFIIMLILLCLQSCIIYDAVNFGYLNILQRPIIDIEADQRKLRGPDIRVFQGTPVWEIAKAIYFYEYFRLDSLIKEKKQYINFQNSKNGATVLGYAIAKNRKQAIRMLLENGADPNIHFRVGNSALHVAIEVGSDIEIIKLLLKHGAKVNDEKNVWRFDVLAWAFEYRSGEEIINLLLDAGADINKSKAMLSVLAGEQIGWVKFLLEKGYDVNTPLYKHEKWYTIRDKMRSWIYPLNSSEYRRKMEIVELLKMKGMDYYKAPVPIAAGNLKRRYPDTWEEYLEKY